MYVSGTKVKKNGSNVSYAFDLWTLMFRKIYNENNLIEHTLVFGGTQKKKSSLLHIRWSKSI